MKKLTENIVVFFGVLNAFLDLILGTIKAVFFQVVIGAIIIILIIKFVDTTWLRWLLLIMFGLAMTAPGWIGWAPFGFTVVINGLEIAIAFIQAYIFTILTCVYIGDAVKLH